MKYYQSSEGDINSVTMNYYNSL